MSTSTVDNTSPSSGQSARKRPRIATQACENCRQRKMRCDEVRPECGQCERLGVECQYKEPLASKLDKLDSATDSILDTLQGLESKLDRLVWRNNTPSMSDDYSSSSDATPTLQSRRGVVQLRDGSDAQPISKHLTLPHMIILWPKVRRYILDFSLAEATALEQLCQQGTPWLIKLEMNKLPLSLPSDSGLVSVPMASQTGDLLSWNVTFPRLTSDLIEEYSNAYFNTFNKLYPVVDQDAFMKHIVSGVLKEGFGESDNKSVLALLVFALGQLAMEGVYGDPIGESNGVPSGFRGGDIERPPGLEMFNEARRRVGFIPAHCTLERAQILFLQATFFEANARHVEFWNSIMAASMAVQMLIRCKDFEWTSWKGDMVSRLYWSCLSNEDLYHLELDLPATGIQNLQDEVPLPRFYKPGIPLGSGNMGAGELSYFQYHFLAMIALRRLISRIHAAVLESFVNPGVWPGNLNSTTMPMVREMSRQLDSWHSLLPQKLRWEDIDPSEAFDEISKPVLQPGWSLNPGERSDSISLNYMDDIMAAQLRTRFYYARYILFQQFLYKAIHFPEQMTPDEASGCAVAINSACLWPISMSPTKHFKRLVPHLFTWTQNFVSALLLFKMIENSSELREMIRGRVNPKSIEWTSKLLRDWLQDVAALDGIAEWSWRVLSPTYASEPYVKN